MAQNNRSEEWEAKRREIFRVAAQVFFDKGFNRGTTRDIARIVGVTQPALYYYVGSKEDLLSEIALEVDHEFTRVVGEAIDSHADPGKRLVAVVRAFVRAMVEHQMGFGLRFSEVRALPEPVATQVDQDERRFVAMIEGAVGDAMAAGVLPASRNSRIVTLGLIGMLSWTFWWLVEGRDDPDEIADTFCEMLGFPVAEVLPRSSAT
jgi:TetR/AcrR family transcriptional regulator, cholesterol catabolism regulator